MRRFMINSIHFFPLLLATALLLSGCAASSQPAAETNQAVRFETSTRHLNISLKQDEDASQIFRPDELGGNFLHNMQYRQVKDVMISLDKETLPLEDALKQGKLTEEDILYFARQDARTGFCKTEAVSLRGVTNFYFHYPEYSIKIIHDVQETPDGGQYLISQMHVYAPKLDMKPTTHFFDPETNVYLDLEDWGLTFDVQQVAPTGITFTCTQSAGQQIGTLAIKYYYLTETTGPFLQKADGTEGAHFEALTLDMDGTSTFTIDWTEWYGALPSGEYIFLLDIFDLFEPEQVPPLTVDFHTRQLYSIGIRIP